MIEKDGSITLKPLEIKMIRDIVEAQGRDGNWDHSEYTRGAYNGMEYILSLIEKREFQYKGPPDVYLEKIYGSL